MVISPDAHGLVRHIVVNHRPRNSVLLFSELMGEKFAGTPYAQHFAPAGY